VADTVDTLVCDGKTLRGSIAETATWAARFIAQVSLYSNSLGVAIAQSTYATDAGGERYLSALLSRPHAPSEHVMTAYLESGAYGPRAS